MNIEIKKKVYQKGKYVDVIDTKFNEFGVNQVVNEVFVPTVDEFFNYYNDLFFTIPKEGSNSHRSLVNSSLEYIGLDKNPLIEELQKEISVLKEELLNSNNTIGELTKQFSTISGQFNTNI